MVKVCYNHTSKEFNKCLRAGNCCLRHPFSPVLEPRQGGDICSLAGLTWPHVIFPATMSSLQYRHGAPPRHGAMCRGPPPQSGGFHPVGGLYPSLASIFPAHYCPLHHLVSFLRAITLTHYHLNDLIDKTRTLRSVSNILICIFWNFWKRGSLFEVYPNLQKFLTGDFCSI